MKLVGESYKIWKGAMHHGIWPEGPHLYKKDGYYYLMHAEGGTSVDHAICIARSKTLTGRYEGCPDNPIFTHRHLGSAYPVIAAGHGDLVDDGEGNWYVVMLASRRCKGDVNTGRDTFLAKVIWENDWPVINPGIGKLEEYVELQGEPVYQMPQENSWHFYRKELPHCFVTLRNPVEAAYSLQEKEGCLRLYLRKERLLGCENASYWGVRQQEYNYRVAALMEFSGGDEGEEAGIAVVCNDKNHYRFVKSYRNGKPMISLIQCLDGQERILAEQEIPEGRIQLSLLSREQSGSWYVQTENGNTCCIAENIDMSVLSTEKTGGFTGCTLGMYASANGNTSQRWTDFYWFCRENI